MELQPSHDDWDKVVMNITTEDKSMNDNDQYESLRGLSLRQLREAKQVRAVHRSMAYRPTNAVSKMLKEGYIVNMPIDGKLLRNVEQIY